MGAWGTGPFANDDASDWVWSLDDASDTGPLRERLSLLVNLDSEEYLESPDCSEAIAAAAVIGMLNTGQANHEDESVDGFLKRCTARPDRELLTIATTALDRIESNSELLDLWKESNDLQDWQSELQTIRNQLT